MIEFLLMIVGYFSLLLGMGFFAYMRTQKTPEDYFIAGRTFGPVVLFFSLAATNFSAFTFLGFAGNAYKIGLGQYGIMGFGTAIMAIMFFVIGRKVWKLGKEKRYLTPPELIGDRFESRSLRLIFMGVMVIFTIPYLAVQAVGAGILIQYVTGSISWQIGAVATIVVVMVYVMLGGMRGSGWADVLQGVLMIAAMTCAVVFVAVKLGGFEQANRLAFEASPVLFTRPGGGEYFTMQIWFSFMLLWVFVDPMFPQLFSLFYTAKNQRSLKVSMILYPVVVSFFFLFPVLLGVWAHGAGLSLAPGSEDMVLPLMVQTFAPSFIFSFVMVGALAALISTADSQLLSLSTLLSHDLLGLKKGRREVVYGKVVIVMLSLLTMVFILGGYNPNEGIMGTLVKTTFSGLVVLCPTTIAALYWKRATKYGCIASILFGELCIVLFHYKMLPDAGFLPGIIAVVLSTLVLVGVSYLSSPKKSTTVTHGA